APPPTSNMGVRPMSDENPLRLSACPNCDYSLTTLPPEGVCPECGRPYDQQFIILAGRGRGRFETSWRTSMVVIVAITFVLMMSWKGRGLRPDPMAIGYTLCGV